MLSWITYTSSLSWLGSGAFVHKSCLPRQSGIMRYNNMHLCFLHHWSEDFVCGNIHLRTFFGGSDAHIVWKGKHNGGTHSQLWRVILERGAIAQPDSVTRLLAIENAATEDVVPNPFQHCFQRRDSIQGACYPCRSLTRHSEPKGWTRRKASSL